MFQNACRRFQNVPECMQDVQLYNVPEGMKISRLKAECSRMFRMHAECYRMFKNSCKMHEKCSRMHAKCSRMLQNACRMFHRILHEFLEHSVTFCMHSGTFQNILLSILKFSCLLEHCRTSCIPSGTFWNLLHAFWNILEQSQTFCNILHAFCMHSVFILEHS